MDSQARDRIVAQAALQETLCRFLTTEVAQAVQMSLYDRFFVALSDRSDQQLEDLKKKVEEIENRVGALLLTNLVRFYL